MPSENPEQPTILLVDDNPENLKLLNVFLRDAGFQIVVAQSGPEALQHITQVHPDLILLDVLMSEMDGFETCQRLKAHATTKDIPVIFLTALTEIVDKIKGFEVGGADYLTKPVQPEEVLARVNTHLTNRKLQHRLQEQNALLEEQSERFRILSEATFEGIFFHDEGHIVEVNQTLEQMFGYQSAEILGKNVLEFVSPKFHQIVGEYLRTKAETPYEAEGIRKDGSLFPVEFQARMMPYHGRDVRVVVIRDLTWRKTMEAEKAQIEKENVALRATLHDRYKFGELIGKSPSMQHVYQTIANASATEANVVIYGESGTGKELVARTIHHLSARQVQAFVPVNCGAVPESLFESEFFGHRKGAFTGADRDRPGYFDQAHRGTLFLDEIGELTPAMQVKLLRVLQDGEYMPVGDTITKTADVRIIAATNKDLKELLHKGVIREDFFYRIRVITINLPPLRERKEDIPLLLDHFLAQYGKEKACLTLPGRVVEMLCAYDWPGNVRELQNELQRYLVEQRLEFLDTLNTQPAGETELIGVTFHPGAFPLSKALEEFEKRSILRVFEQQHGNRKTIAAMLGINRKTLYTKLKKYGVI
jgi:formate hydrogenlyase transcriptional activator